MISVAKPMVDNDEIKAVVKVLKSGSYTSGKIVEKFEEEFASYIGTKYAVACNSGTAALHMVYLFLGFNKNINFITSPMSFFATISAGIMCGAYPIFVDVNDRCNINAKLIEASITDHTKAIVPIHLYGHPCEIEEVIRIGDLYKIPVIEDCAQAHGAEYKGKKVGSFGFAGCFSFFATKNMTTIEGGMITTNDFSLNKYCKKIRSHGMSDRDTHVIIGYNYRMTELNAAIGRIQLNKLDELNKKRIKHSLYLQNHINNPYIKVCRSYPYVKDVYFWQPVYTKYPKEFMLWLQKHEVEVRHRYWEPLYKQPVLNDRYKNLILPNAEILSGIFFGLPNYPGLSQEDLEKVVGVVNAFKI